MVPWPFGRDGRALKQAKAAVAVAQRVSTLIAVESLCDALDVGLASPHDPALLERLLLSLEPTARSLMQAMLDTLASSLDNPARFGLWGFRASALIERLCQSYQLVLTERGREADASLLSSTCYWAVRRMLLSRVAGDTFDDPPWQLLLQGLRGNGSQIPTVDQFEECVRTAISELILMNLVLRRPLEPAQCFVTARCLAELAPLLLLDNAFSRATPCLLMPDNHGLPQRLEGWQMADEDNVSLFCGFYPLRRSIEEKQALLKAGQALFADDAVSEDQRELQMMVLDQLRSTVGRAAADHPEIQGPERRTLAAFDFLRIRVLLANPLRPVPKHDALIRDVEVLAFSSEGVDLLLEAGNEYALLNGLLAFFWRDEWWLCVIRRLRREVDGRQFVGARLLARSAIAARFLLVENAERNVLGHAVFVPDSRAEGGQILLAQMHVDVGCEYTLDLERRERRVCIERIVEAGAGYVQLAVNFCD